MLPAGEFLYGVHQYPVSLEQKEDSLESGYLSFFAAPFLIDGCLLLPRTLSLSFTHAHSPPLSLSFSRVVS